MFSGAGCVQKPGRAAVYLGRCVRDGNANCLFPAVGNPNLLESSELYWPFRVLSRFRLFHIILDSMGISSSQFYCFALNSRSDDGRIQFLLETLRV